MNLGNPPPVPPNQPDPNNNVVGPNLQDLTDILRHLTLQQTANASRRTAPQARPKVISCRIFRIGENWTSYSTHFVECVRAACGYTLPNDEARLHAECLVWLPSKLEPGPTLTAYEGLEAADKATWQALTDALTKLFVNATERETFLADTGSFKRMNKGLLEYKTEVRRLTTTHKPGLSNVPEEFEREMVTRFIEGLNDERLMRKLRRHCKRENNTLECAYNFAVDYEAAELQNSIRNGETTSNKGLSALENTKVPYNGNGSEVKRFQAEMQSMASKQKINELRIQELAAKQAHTDDKLGIVTKEVGEMSTNVNQLRTTVQTGFGRLETLLMQGHSNTQTVQYTPRPTGPRLQNQGYRPQNQYQNTRGGYNTVRPLTNNVGYVNNAVQPTGYRMIEPGSSMPVRPVPTQQAAIAAPRAAAAPVAAAAAMEGQAGTVAIVEKPEAEPTVCYYETPSFWSPGMLPDATGYDEQCQGSYSYGQSDFYAQ